jgi:hypothetical protein
MFSVQIPDFQFFIGQETVKSTNKFTLTRKGIKNIVFIVQMNCKYLLHFYFYNKNTFFLQFWYLGDMKANETYFIEVYNEKIYKKDLKLGRNGVKIFFSCLLLCYVSFLINLCCDLLN